jgi:hypothetical protein
MAEVFSIQQSNVCARLDYLYIYTVIQ